MHLFSLTHSYNVEFAKKYGVRSAILFSHILSLITTKQYSNSSDDGVLLSREEINNSTGLSDEEQRVAEESLGASGIISVKASIRNGVEKNRYILLQRKSDENSSDDSLPAVFTAVVSRPVNNKADVKRDCVRKSLKASIPLKDEMLRNLMGMWIDAIFENPKGFLSKQGVSIAVDELLKFSSDVNVLAEIITIAIKFGYKDMSWAINNYKNKAYSAKPQRNEPQWASYDDTKATKIFTENGSF